MDMIQKLEALLETYAETYRKVRAKAPAFAGIFGLGADPKRDPCHQAFLEGVTEAVTEFAGTQPASPDADTVIRWLLGKAEEHQDDQIVWYLYAIQGQAQPLVPFLDRAAAAETAKWFDDICPRRKRLPIQQDIYKALTKQGK